MKRRGFTLIELVVVVALLAILATLVVMGVGKLQTNSKRQQTRLIMQNLQNMLSELDKDRRVPYGAGNLSPSVISGLKTYIAMPSPGDVTNTTQVQGVQNDRFGIYAGNSGNAAVLITRSFMAQLMSVPNVSTSIGKFPSSQLMTFIGANLPGTPSVWSGANQYNLYSTVLYTDFNGQSVVYIRSQIWADTAAASAGTLLYDDQQSYTSGQNPSFVTNAPPNYYFWMPTITVPANPTSPLPTPVVLDAWGNPIIFVMGGVLGNGAALVNGAVSPGSGALMAGGNTFQVHSPDYHPFFASAGPDGDFSKGDDNLYSFEK